MRNLDPPFKCDGELTNTQDCIQIRVLQNRGVMIPFFSGIRIGIGSGQQEPESESHGIDSKMESIPRLESVPYLESNPSMELIPVPRIVLPIILKSCFFPNKRLIN